MKPIVKLYYYEETGNGDIFDWALTGEIEIASKGLNWRTADLHDLESNGVCDYLRNKVLHLDEGFFTWDDTYDDWFCVDDIKTVLLDWMEHLEMENSLLYEDVISMKPYKIHSWLDLNRIGFGVLA